jgi:maleylpyruvate isomerase
MRLYSYWRSSCSYRVRIALGLKSADYEYEAVDISLESNAQHTAEYEAINSARMVPVLELDESPGSPRLTQSVAIIEYLDERFPEPALFPRDALGRARVREAVEVVNSSIQPLQNLAVVKAVRRAAPDVTVSAWSERWVVPGLATLERLAQRNLGTFSVGEQVTAADVFLVPQLYAARRFDIDVSAFPHLTRIEASCLLIDAFRRAHPDRQPDAPLAPDTMRRRT